MEPLNIPITPVKSSSLSGFGYDVATSTLAVQFKVGGPIYQYAGVPAEVFAKMQGAESFGRFFAAEIKGKFGDPLKIPPAPKPEAAEEGGASAS